MYGFLVLEDGTILEGLGFGASKTVFGELVFNTSMTGFQEALTDPSYNGQILMFTYPQVANYGMNTTAIESDRVQCEALVVRDFCEYPVHRSMPECIDTYLKRYNIPGIAGVDTRFLTRKIRALGTMKAAVAVGCEKKDTETLLKEVRRLPAPETSNLVAEVCCKNVMIHRTSALFPKIVIIDCGLKLSILRQILRFANVIQVPYDICAEELRRFKPAGVLISNGPGDPAHPELKSTVVRLLREICADYPVAGICLGHQLIALAFHHSTYKLKFGHRGSNQPVKELASGKIVITSQNHGFAVAPSNSSELEITEINNNDMTVEGLRHRSLPLRTVQYHPEGAPGPKDAISFFEKFAALMRRAKKN